MSLLEKCRRTSRRTFGIDRLRLEQETAMIAVLDGRDALSFWWSARPSQESRCWRFLWCSELVTIGALFLRLNSIAFGEPRGPNHKAKDSYLPMFAHLALVLVAGFYLPGPLVAWFQNVARVLG